MIELEKYFEPNFFYLKNDNPTYTFSPLRILKDKNEKEIKEEKDVVEAVDVIKNFTDKYALSFFEFLENLQMLDESINGEGEHFWLDDNQKKIGMNRFDVRRIVIAKLAKSHEEYKKFTDKLMAIEEKRIEQIRQSDEKYKDLKNWFVPKILTHLEEIVK